MFQGKIHEGLTCVLSALATHEHSRNFFLINHLRKPISAKQQRVFIQQRQVSDLHIDFA